LTFSIGRFLAPAASTQAAAGSRTEQPQDVTASAALKAISASIQDIVKA
jgi:hypothetical protein